MRMTAQGLREVGMDGANPPDMDRNKQHNLHVLHMYTLWGHTELSLGINDNNW